MTRFFKLPALTLTAPAALIAAGLPAQADITAEHVWQNLTAPIEALGGTVTAETTREGDSLRVGETELAFTLPFDLGNLRFTSTGVILREMGDGTVEMTYDGPMTGRFVVEGPEGEMLSMTMEIRDYETVTTASGDPGDITYAYALDAADIVISELTLPEEGEMEVDIKGRMEGLTGTYRIIEGDLVTLSAESENGTINYDMALKDQYGIESVASQKVTGGTSRASITIPAGKVGLTNLSQALRDGLVVSIEGADTRLDVESEGRLDGEVISKQKYGYLTDTISYLIDADGIDASGRNSDIWMEFSFGPEMPIDLKATAEAATGRLKMPLNKTDGRAPAALAMGIEALVLDEGLWSMVDPGGALPQDPVNFTLDLAGEVEVLQDLLDVEGWMAMPPDAGSPVLPHTLDINRLAFDAVGTSLDATGAFTFDNSDLETFDGMPAPDGYLEMSASGVDVLLDTLVAMGLVPEEDIAGARMVLGMVAVPGDTPGSYQSRIEVKPDGQVLANGQRLR